MMGHSGVCHFPGCRRDAVAVCRDEPCCDEHFVLRDAGWRCEAIIDDRRPWVDAKVRCPIMGSEISVAANGQARCPRHREEPDV